MSDLSLHTRVMLVSRVWMAVQFYFAHWHDVDTDFDLENDIADLMQTALETESRLEFTLAMMRFIAKLNNTHTWYRDFVLEKEHLQKRAYDLSTVDAESWIVQKSYVDSLQAGDVITAIDGKSCRDWFIEVRPYMNASSERIARRLFGRFVRMFIPQVVTMSLDDGRTVTVDHDLATPPLSWNEQETTGHWIEKDKIALIYIPSFNDERFQETAIDYVTQFKDAQTIIFDLRDCQGGNTPTKLIDALMDRPYKMWSEATPIHFGLFHYRQQERQQGLAHAAVSDDAQSGYYSAMEEHFRHPMFMWNAPLQAPKTPIYTGQVILLISSSVGSAGEDFVIPFKTSGRATLIGENTIGSTGQPYHYRISNDIWLAIGTKRAYFPDGSQYEGIGIAPDIAIQATLADLKAKRDVVLEKALEVAQS